MHARLLSYLACPRCEGRLASDEEDGDEISSGRLECSACHAQYPVVDGVPVLLDGPELTDDSTSRIYSDIWRSHGSEFLADTARRSYDAPARSHDELLRLASGRDAVVPGIGIDAGCGFGHSALTIAAARPEVEIIGVDLSEGPLQSARRALEIPNAQLIRGNLLAPPLARERFDFAYSFGVLHHTPDPRRAFRLLIERLRPGGRVTIFLYKDFADVPLKRFMLRQVNRLRRMTLKMSPRTLRALSRAAAPLVYLLLTIPARVLGRVGLARVARHIPYGTFPDPSRIASSLEDRFGAPYEFRFSAGDLERWASEEGLEAWGVVDCLPWGFSGLVLYGTRAADS